MDDLLHKTCLPCEGGVAPLEPQQVEALLAKLDGAWQLDQSQGIITRVFCFRNYYETTAFIQAVAWIAHRENHHPDIRFGYREAAVSYTTHAIGGLSENDFICAAKVDALLA
jgi:4a-hydroxytetrahydrobiopterin dehydratase